jgi:hypothetical protein
MVVTWILKYQGRRGIGSNIGGGAHSLHDDTGNHSHHGPLNATTTVRCKH